MQPEERIRQALAQLGEGNVLDWARKHATRSLVELSAVLAAGVAPIDLERFMADCARDSGRFDEFVRDQAVRRLNENFPNGFGNSNKQQYGLAAGWAMWAGLFEPSHQHLAKDTWDRLGKTLREHPD
jgi:hypothetical protein